MRELKLATIQESADFQAEGKRGAENLGSFFSSCGSCAARAIAEYLANTHGKTLYTLRAKDRA